MEVWKENKQTGLSCGINDFGEYQRLYQPAMALRSSGMPTVGWYP